MEKQDAEIQCQLIGESLTLLQPLIRKNDDSIEFVQSKVLNFDGLAFQNLTYLGTCAHNLSSESKAAQRESKDLTNLNQDEQLPMMHPNTEILNVNKQITEIINVAKPMRMMTYRHRLTRSQCIQSVYQFLETLQVIMLQQLDRRHYDQIIPLMLYQLDNQLGSRLIYWQFEQIVVYDVLTRERHFFQHYKLQRSLATFSVVGATVFLIGGTCSDHNSLHSGMRKSEYQISAYQLNQVQNQDMFTELEQGWLLYPRLRSTCLTDGAKFIFILGSAIASAAWKVEKYSVTDGSITELAQLPELNQIFWSQACLCNYGRNGLKVYLIQKESMFSLDVSPSLSQNAQWSPINIDLRGLEFRKSGMISLTDKSILLFGGESLKSYSEDSNKTFILRKINQDSFSIEQSSNLPKGCTPAVASYCLNNNSAYYFISNEGIVFRLNKLEMKWSHWN